MGGVAAALWLAGRPEDAVAVFAACDRLVARKPAHEADETLHLPLRRRFEAEAQAALSATAAGSARQRLASLDPAMTAAAARDLAASVRAGRGADPHVRAKRPGQDPGRGLQVTDARLLTRSAVTASGARHTWVWSRVSWYW